MNQKHNKNTKLVQKYIYKGSIDCLIKVCIAYLIIKIIFMYILLIYDTFQTVKYEGIFALYKGFIPTFVRMGPWNIIFFVIYERLKTI